MTAFATSNIPTNVNTIEKLHAWSGGIIYDLNKFSPYKESESSGLIPIVTLQDGLAAERTERMILRVSLKLAPNWRTSSDPFYLNVTDFSEAGIPEDYLP